MAFSDHTPEEQDRIRAGAQLDMIASTEILAILAERMMADPDPAQWTPSATIGALIVAAYQASQGPHWSLPPADYVALIRRHADVVERVHSQTDEN